MMADLCIQPGRNGTIDITRPIDFGRGETQHTLRVHPGEGAILSLQNELKRHCRRTLRKEALQGHDERKSAWSYTIHPLAHAWLAHEKIDLACALTHRGTDLASEFKAEIAHTNGNWGSIRYGEFSLEDGLIFVESLAGGQGADQFEISVQIGRTASLTIYHTLPQSVVGSLAGRLLPEVIELPFTGDFDALRILKARSFGNATIITVEEAEEAIADLPQGVGEDWKTIT